jgi:hypothetical protein
MSKKILVTEKTIENLLKQHVENCDADELGRLAGYAFGGECFPEDEDTYSFVPGECYDGSFGEINT